ncbi:hypothetical protein [Billgrantia desiderata]|uniref:hypothetical protein n=1 Tax=Billgrantia desiderata TaxID=52021 RepID=UPI001F298629|nr:hypothetical protein [Halomonas desiderata]MCE8014384.1 hypothetical protein [Halomonas desiderata]
MRRTFLAAAAVATLGASSLAQAANELTLGAVAGTTGAGADLSWRFSDRWGVSARYTGGLSWSGDFDDDDIEYAGDIDLRAGAMTLDYYPFSGGFFFTAGVMLPDMEANATGRARDGMTYELGSNTYTADQLGEVRGTVTLADSVQPYAGIGYRKSHRNGFGFFGEFGVMATNIDVSLSTSNDYESADAQFRDDLRAEERRIKDDIDKLPFYPVALIGVTYTF